MCDAGRMIYMYNITDVSIKLQEPAEHAPPVPYNENIATTSKLAKIIFNCGFERTALDKRLSEFCEKLILRQEHSLIPVVTVTPGLSAATAVKENIYLDIDNVTLTLDGLSQYKASLKLGWVDKAEAVVKELIRIYLYIKTRNEISLTSLGLLEKVVEICIKYKIATDAYVNYAISECMSLNSSKYNSNLILDLFTKYMYDTTSKTQHVQYFLHGIRHLRFQATIKYSSHPNNDQPIEEEQKHINLSTTKLLPFVDLPYIATQDNGVIHCKTALSNITRIVGASPDVALLMLRYGATPRHPFSGKLLSRKTPGDFVCRYIRRLLKQEFMGQPIRETFAAVTENIDMKDSFKMLQYMLRADPYFIVKYTSMCSWNDGLNDEGYRDIRPSTLRQETDKAQPIIDSRLRDHFLPPCLTESVPSLLRLSRYVMRGLLLQNRQLPEGIKNLPVPEHLKPNLDLLED